MNDEIRDDEEFMEVVFASGTEIVAKPRNVKDLAKNAKAKKMTKEEERKFIEENIIGEFTD